MSPRGENTGVDQRVCDLELSGSEQRIRQFDHAFSTATQLCIGDLIGNQISRTESVSVWT
jgi:hypothetical protein